MFQKFYEDTLIGRFIKRLLRSTNLPIPSVIECNDYIVAGCQYLFRGFIIEALTSGQFCVNPDNHFGVGLYYTDVVDEEETGTDGKIKRADYKVICQYDENNKQHAYNFHSRFMYYDPETHYHLGEYLRYLRDTTDLNLLPYYNCYSGKSIDEIILNSDKTISVTKNSDKILLVPVKYGKTYTIALESTSPITLQPIIYHDDTGLVIEDYTIVLTPSYYSSNQALTNSQIKLSTSRFGNPFTFNVPTAPNKKYYQQERNLYLAIQVPLELNSGLVVLEGDYSNCWQKVITNCYSNDYSNDYTNFRDIKNLTLLHFDSKSNIAFSDRLIEYLLLSVVNKSETLDGNIEYVQSILGKLGYTNFYSIRGVWDDKIQERLGHYAYLSKSINLLRDLDGYLNKDLEMLLLENT